MPGWLSRSTFSSGHDLKVLRSSPTTCLWGVCFSLPLCPPTRALMCSLSPINKILKKKITAVKVRLKRILFITGGRSEEPSHRKLTIKERDLEKRRKPSSLIPVRRERVSFSSILVKVNTGKQKFLLTSENILLREKASCLFILYAPSE